MTSKLTRLLLFLSSYFPLALIFFFLYIQKHPYWALAILGAGLVGVGGLFWYLRHVNRFASTLLIVDTIRGRDSDAMSYLVTYLVPFLSIPFSRPEQAAALAVF